MVLLSIDALPSTVRPADPVPQLALLDKVRLLISSPGMFCTLGAPPPDDDVITDSGNAHRRPVIRHGPRGGLRCVASDPVERRRDRAVLQHLQQRPSESPQYASGLTGGASD